MSKTRSITDEKDGIPVRRRGRPRKDANLQGKKLFEQQDSSDEDSISASENDQDDDEDDDDEQQPLIHTFRSSVSKLRSLRVQQQEANGQAGPSRTTGSFLQTLVDLFSSLRRFSAYLCCFYNLGLHIRGLLAFSLHYDSTIKSCLKTLVDPMHSTCSDGQLFLPFPLQRFSNGCMLLLFKS